MTARGLLPDQRGPRIVILTGREGAARGAGSSILGLMVVASFGVIPAVGGALAQEVVDIVVIASSLRAMQAGHNESRGFATLQDRSARVGAGSLTAANS